MCNKFISEDPFKLKHFDGRYKTQEMCNKVVDDFFASIKICP